jgi:inositol transport system substrate-binding protein
MQGGLSNRAAVQRTQNYYDRIKASKCAVKVNIIDQQTANWSRDQAQSLMTNWLSTCTALDGVLAKNDEMAIGTIHAMKAAAIDMNAGIISGVDATQDALVSMQAGGLDIAVFQNAAPKARRT